MPNGHEAEAPKRTATGARQLDLDNCAREPIHVPGSIQPHGALLALSEPGLQVRQASANADAIFAVPVSPGARLADLLPADALRELRVKLTAARLSAVNPIKLSLPGGPCNVIAHRSQGLLLLEFEPIPDLDFAYVFRVHQGVNAALEAIAEAPDMQGLWDAAAQQVKVLTGYDRVMIYRFDRDWNGQVVAEAREPRQETFLGLHYPASDIPAQARALYKRNWLRLIPDVRYTPVPLLAEAGAEAPLDLSGSVLRSVSPMHVQYLRNMGVGASMSVSILCDGELWGLIACHHDGAAPLPYELRQGLELIGKFLSSQIEARDKQDDQEYRQELLVQRQRLLAQMSAEQDFLDGLHCHPLNLTALARGCTGAAIHYRGRTTLIGEAPPVEAVRKLAAWLPNRLDEDGLFITEALAAQLPEAEAWKDRASGLLCISIPEPEPSYVLWFKPEVLRTVDWGGNPDKPVEASEEGARLSPRRSFELWRETLRLHALPWAREEIEAVEALRRDIIELDLQRQVAAALASNEELDHFAHIVAHDLKEPLRGIHAFAGFLAEDLDERLDPESRANLGEIRGLAEQGRRMISELFEFSRLGRVELAVEDCDLNEVLREVCERLGGALSEGTVELRTQPLPRLRCDRVRIAEVFANLLGNALKYNDSPVKRIEVGVEPSGGATPRLYVRDNGIGIAADQQERVFRIFERLHAPGGYGGGSGSGLAITRRIVERHGGRLWLESAPGAGSTFFFTLSPQPDAAAEVAR